MDDKITTEVKTPEIDAFALFEYFSKHPIMLAGVGISAMTLAICKFLDDKFNN